MFHLFSLDWRQNSEGEHIAFNFTECCVDVRGRKIMKTISTMSERDNFPLRLQEDAKPKRDDSHNQAMSRFACRASWDEE